MLATVLLAVALTAAPTPITVSGPVDAAAIDTVVTRWREATGTPGVAVAVTRGREVVHTAGYGHTAEGDPVTDRTVLAVASVSKAFTGVAVAQLADAGRIDLDAQVRRYLPDFTTRDDRSDRITVRQLLHHTSGLSDTTYRPFSGPVPQTLAEAVTLLRTADLAADPGARFDYHNPNYQLAARIVEVVSGEPFADYLRRHVFGPLGMHDSRSANVSADLPTSSRGHIRIAGLSVALPEPPAFGAGSGGVLSTAHDLSRWLIFQQDPQSRPVLSATGLAETHRPSHFGHGFGWYVGTTDSGAPLRHHSGHMLTFTAYHAVLPASGYGIAVLSNARTGHADAPELGDLLVDLIEGRPVGRPGPSPAWIDVLLLAGVPAVVLLAARGVRRARRWADRPRHRLGTTLRLLTLTAPIALLVTLHRIAGSLYRGRDISWWQTTYLYPTFVALLAVTAAAGLLVLAARLRQLHTRRGRAS
ncbi:serine hydrolase domain-containing protein [Micromonospora sp. NPDC049903]|uniref:serine hydrolase domain-containing protein n=1 Tax=Micromonospora sp. NPDC049903 TaxID=3364276 RepID=UPI0037A48A36